MKPFFMVFCPSASISIFLTKCFRLLTLECGLAVAWWFGGLGTCSFFFLSFFFLYLWSREARCHVL